LSENKCPQDRREKGRQDQPELKEEQEKNDDEDKQKDAAAGHSDSFGNRTDAAICEPSRLVRGWGTRLSPSSARSIPHRKQTSALERTARDNY